MCANVQRHGRPAEYRWCRLFNAAKFGWHPLLECCAVTLPRRESSWNLQGVPQTRQQISAFRRRKFTILWRHVGDVWVFNRFFLWLSINASAAKTQPDKVERWCQNGDFLRPVFSASRVQHISDMHSKFALRPRHVWKYGRHPICDGWD